MALTISKTLKNFYVLIHFYEENSYSVVKLKDAVSSSTSISVFQSNEPKKLEGWDTSEIVNVPWSKGEVYPAFFLQFGENKKEMEDLADELTSGKLSKSEVPVLQVCHTSPAGSRLKTKECEKENNDGSSAANESSLNDHRLTKSTLQREILLDVKKKVSTSRLHCEPCKHLKKQLIECKEGLSNAEEEIRQLKIKVAHYKERSKKYKRLSREIKDQLSEDAAVGRPLMEEMLRLGETTMVSKSKLSMCRTTDFSKYVGDLLDVLFPTEVLGNSVIKGIKGAKKTNVLDQRTVNDLQQHVAEKFCVPIQNVRAAIRQKLNVAHKIIKMDATM